MIKYIAIYVILMLILSFLFNSDLESISKNLNKRKQQSAGMTKRSLWEEKLDNKVQEKISVTKRNRTVLQLSQAGINISYTEYLVFRIVSGILFGVILGSVLDNIPLSIIFTLLGFFIPHQVVMFIRNKRVVNMEKQIGSFMHMLIKRYEMSKDMSQALIATAKEFEGEEPIYSEINKTINMIELGSSVFDGLDDFADRVDNKYMKRFASYYEIASSVGTEQIRTDLLNQALLQYNESNDIKQELQKEISGPVQEAYIMTAAVPILGIYQSFTNPDYIHFYTKVTMGKVSLAIMVAVLLAVIWFTHNKLGATLE